MESLQTTKRMKNLLLLFFCLVSIAAKSQDYLNETCIWKVKDYAYIDLTYFNSDYYDHINGDTLIDGTGYYKLYRKGSFYNGFTPTDSMFYSEINDYLGAIREEDKTWVWVEKDSLESKILFDFNLKEGDSVKFYGRNYNLILSDSIFHGGTYKKVYRLEDTLLDLIEGVGFITGVVPSLWRQESVTYIQCFSKDGENLNPDLFEFEKLLDELFENLESCEEVLSSSINPNIYEHDIIIFPNPAYDLLNVKLNNSNANTITILNLEGKELFHKKVNNQLMELEINGLENGIYFLKIRMDDKVLVRKFVKR